MEWLLHQDTLREMQETKRAGLVPTPEQIEAFTRRHDEEEANGTPRNLTVAGNVAEILVEGVLTERPRFMFFREGTPYSDIRSALAIADADPNIKSAVLRVNSPGGNVDGLFDTIAAIEQFSKPIKAIASKAQSAAFALATATGRVEAAGKASEFGSIGVAITFIIFDDEVTLTNTDSPEKRPDPTTDEGKASIVAHLDAINELFVEAIASGRTRAGRPTTKTEVKTGFGRGATLLAQAAKRAGMIDRIVGQRAALRSVTLDDHDDEDSSAGLSATDTPADSGTETRPMDRNTLKTEHAELFATIVQEGVTEERDRVGAHLQFGSQAGAEGMKIALEAIGNGDAMTQTLQAKYMTAGMNKAATATHQLESDTAAKTVADVVTDPAPAAEDMGDKVFAAMEKGRTAA